MTCWRAVAAALPLLCACQLSSAACARDVDGLRQLLGDAAFALQWLETGMSDGKPLRLVIAPRDGALHFHFEKSREGLWAEGRGEVCATPGGLAAVFEPGALQPGPAASWLLRRSLPAGGRFELSRPRVGELLVGTLGWRGRFVPAQAEVPGDVR